MIPHNMEETAIVLKSLNHSLQINEAPFLVFDFIFLFDFQHELSSNSEYNLVIDRKMQINRNQRRKFKFGLGYFLRNASRNSILSL